MDIVQEASGLWDLVASLERGYRAHDHLGYLTKQKDKCIYRFPHELKSMDGNIELYTTPLLASFGPYHHGKPHLQAMELHKERALYRILQRKKFESPRPFVESLQKHQEQLMDSYDDLDPGLSPDSFIKMMLLDGCFLLEILRFQPGESDGADPIFSNHGLVNVLILIFTHDMLLIENQIPLPALKLLLEVELGGINVENELNNLFCGISIYVKGVSSPIDHNSLHVLDIRRRSLIRISLSSVKTSGTEGGITTSRSCCSSALPFIACRCNFRILSNHLGNIVRKILWRKRQIPFVRSAKQLYDMGVTFRCNRLRDLGVEFDELNGVLTLPLIELDDSSSAMYRNMMAFEHKHHNTKKEVSSFIGFMSKIIDTAEDVRFLRLQGILEHMVGSDEEAALIFNTMGKGIVILNDVEKDQIYARLGAYVDRSWHAWRANLVHKYFNNPWTCSSFFAAILLLILTIVQTVFAVLDYTKNP